MFDSMKQLRGVTLQAMALEREAVRVTRDQVREELGSGGMSGHLTVVA